MVRRVEITGIEATDKRFFREGVDYRVMFVKDSMEMMALRVGKIRVTDDKIIFNENNVSDE